MRDTIKQRIMQVRRGEVPKGYHKTQAGIIPKQWQCDRLGKYIKNYNELSNDVKHLPVVTSSRQGLLLQSEYYTEERLTEKGRGYHVVPRGYVTYRHMSDDQIFRFNLNTMADKVLVSPEYPVFCTTEKMNLSLLVLHLNTSRQFESFCQAQKKGSTRTRMYFKNLGQYILPVPPIAEQQKIAEILAQCDKIIALKQELLDEKHKQKKWLMQRLLTGKTRLNGYAGKWKSASMQKLFSFGGALAASREQLGDEGLCYLHYGDIHANDTFKIDVKREYARIPKLKCDKVQDRYLLKDGDVAFVDASEDYLGASKYVVIINPDNIPFISGLHTMPIREKGDELLTAYKRYCFQSGPFVRQIAFYVSGMKILGVNKDNLGKIVLKYPPKDEQAAIANVLSISDKGIDLLEQELAAWKEKKKGLDQLLLTGLVRV